MANIIIEEERYKRQVALWGNEKQAKLASAEISIVGMQEQGLYLALALTALGVGNINLIDANSTSPKQFLGIPLNNATPSVKSYAQVLSQVNPQLRIDGIQSDLESRIDRRVLNRSTVVIDATNSIDSKSRVAMYCQGQNIPFISTSSQWGYTKCVPPKTKLTPITTTAEEKYSHLLTAFEGTAQDTLMALMMCGVVTEEVRKIIFNEKENYLTSPIRYSLTKNHFGYPQKDALPQAPDQSKYEQLKIAFLGGGAIGCWAAIASAQMGFGQVDIFDYDKFESHNINRQVLGFDGIDELKAPHVAKKMQQMSPHKTIVRGINKLITPDMLQEEHPNYDLAFDFVDNMYTRAVNTAFALSRGIPLLSAGALPLSARLIAQVPNKTQCQNCLYDIFRRGREEEMIRRASCAQVPNPSVVMSNAVAGALALAEVYRVIEPEKYGLPANGELTYRHDAPSRFGTNPMQSPCSCHTKSLPSLTISDEEVKIFVQNNPERLQQQ